MSNKAKQFLWYCALFDLFFAGFVALGMLVYGLSFWTALGGTFLICVICAVICAVIFFFVNKAESYSKDNK